MIDDFASKLRLALDILNVSRAQLAHELGVHKSVVGRWVGGKVNPTEHNLSRVTALIKRSRGTFSLADWRSDFPGFAAALGAGTRGIEPPDETSTAPSEPGSQPRALSSRAAPIGLGLRTPMLVRRDIAREAATYEGFYRLFRFSLGNVDMIALESIEIRRVGEDLAYRSFDGWYAHTGFVLPLGGQLFFIGEEAARLDELVFMVINGINQPRAMVLDGILLSVSGDKAHTPAATVIVMQFDSAIRPDPAENDAAWQAMCAETLGVNTERRAAELMPPEFRHAIESRVGSIRDDGGFDWVLRVPPDRSLAAGDIRALNPARTKGRRRQFRVKWVRKPR